MNNDLISREALKEQVKNEVCEVCFDSPDERQCSPNCKLCTFKQLIDNAPTVPIPNEQTAWEQGFEAGLAQGKHDRPKGEWIRLDLAKRIIAKFEGYLDDDMVARIQIALEKENEADMKGGAE